MQGLTEGRIVHFVLPDGKSEGEHRPAIVVRVWAQSETEATVNLTVFTDHHNDYDPHKSQTGNHPTDTYLVGGEYGIMWATSVQYDETKAPGTWHWIEPA